MPVEHLPASTTPEKVAEILDRDACCVVDHVVDPGLMDQARSELAGWMDSVALGRELHQDAALGGQPREKVEDLAVRGGADLGLTGDRADEGDPAILDQRSDLLLRSGQLVE